MVIKSLSKTLYETLNVPENASSIEIKQAFRKMVREHHPDKVASENNFNLITQAENEMIKINNAKEILLDPIKRSRYDLELQEFRSNEILKAQEFTEIIEDLEPDDDQCNIQGIPIPEQIQQTPVENIGRKFRTRHLPFCPVCTRDNIYDNVICNECGGILVEPGMAQMLGERLAANGYPIFYRPTQVDNPFYKNLQYPCIRLSTIPEPGQQTHGENFDISTKTRHLPFCPVCTRENNDDKVLCNECGGILVEPGMAQMLGERLAANGYQILYRPTQVDNPFYKDLYYPCIQILKESNR